MQQAVKPLGYPRGVLSPEGFQRIAPQNPKEKNVSEKEKRNILL